MATAPTPPGPPVIQVTSEVKPTSEDNKKMFGTPDLSALQTYYSPPYQSQTPIVERKKEKPIKVTRAVPHSYHKGYKESTLPTMPIGKIDFDNPEMGFSPLAKVGLGIGEMDWKTAEHISPMKLSSYQQSKLAKEDPKIRRGKVAKALGLDTRDSATMSREELIESIQKERKLTIDRQQHIDKLQLTLALKMKNLSAGFTSLSSQIQSAMDENGTSTMVQNVTSVLREKEDLQRQLKEEKTNRNSDRQKITTAAVENNQIALKLAALSQTLQNYSNRYYSGKKKGGKTKFSDGSVTKSKNKEHEEDTKIIGGVGKEAPMSPKSGIKSTNPWVIKLMNENRRLHSNIQYLRALMDDERRRRKAQETVLQGADVKFQNVAYTTDQIVHPPTTGDEVEVARAEVLEDIQRLELISNAAPIPPSVNNEHSSAAVEAMAAVMWGAAAAAAAVAACSKPATAGQMKIPPTSNAPRKHGNGLGDTTGMDKKTGRPKVFRQGKAEKKTVPPILKTPERQIRSPNRPTKPPLKSGSPIRQQMDTKVRYELTPVRQKKHATSTNQTPNRERQSNNRSPNRKVDTYAHRASGRNMHVPPQPNTNYSGNVSPQRTAVRNTPTKRRERAPIRSNARRSPMRNDRQTQQSTARPQPYRETRDTMYSGQRSPQRSAQRSPQRKEYKYNSRRENMGDTRDRQRSHSGGGGGDRYRYENAVQSSYDERRYRNVRGDNGDYYERSDNIDRRQQYYSEQHYYRNESNESGRYGGSHGNSSNTRGNPYFGRHYNNRYDDKHMNATAMTGAPTRY